MVQMKSEGSRQCWRIPSCLEKQMFLFRPSADWMWPTYSREDNLLYPKFTNLNVNCFICQPSKLTYKINHHILFAFYALIILHLFLASKHGSLSASGPLHMLSLCLAYPPPTLSAQHAHFLQASLIWEASLTLPLF